MISEDGEEEGLPSLFRHFPSLASSTPWHRIGRWPTPIESFCVPGDGKPFYVKREDLSSSIYGGNKVRTLEGHFGAALADQATEIWSCGAFGSNHATATVLHAEGTGLRPGVALFRQPPTPTATANLRAMLCKRPLTRNIANVALVPWVLARIGSRPGAYVMPPGGASPTGALGHVGAAFELAEQIESGICPPPRTIILPVGSTCTTAGLLAGLHLAAQRKLAFGTTLAPIPRVLAVRATPWPVTSRYRIIDLAKRTIREISRRIGTSLPIDVAAMDRCLTVDGHFIGRGYGRPAASTRGAIATMARLGGPRLDVVYSGKAGAALFQRYFTQPGAEPLLLWSTKSAAKLPEATAAEIEAAPKRWQRWLGSAPVI